MKKKTFLGLSWVGWLNFLILQWFCVRLAYIENTETKEVEGYKWIKGVAPLTGWSFTWWKEYTYLTKQGTRKSDSKTS